MASWRKANAPRRVQDGPGARDQRGRLQGGGRYITKCTPAGVSIEVVADEIVDDGFFRCVRAADLAVWPSDMCSALITCATDSRNPLLCFRIWYEIPFFVQASKNGTDNLTAPMVWLEEHEQYFPSDIYAQVQNTHPAMNFTPVAAPPLTLDNLDALNSFGNNGSNIYLTSNVDVTKDPKWLDGVVPNSAGRTENAISTAIIVNDRGNGTVDAFYMYFYAYNMGNTVLFQELGDHIGDWEHNMVRFKDGKPEEIWYSQHNNGEAFDFSAVEKMGDRPVTYSARGSHANYATKGTHDHTIPDFNLPLGPLQDYTSQGTLWDPTLSSYFYTFNGTTNTFTNADGKSPVGAMYFKGKWGDQQYPMSDKRQKDFFGFKKFTSGPTGPWDKQLNRTKVCPSNGILCIVRGQLAP
jgi:hypothetical protein